MEKSEAVEKRVAEFLIQRRVAVAGVSRTGSKPGNSIYKRMQSCGFEVYAVNPKATEIDGQPCFPDLKSIPVKPDALVIATRPQQADELVRQCVELGIPRVWLHRSLGTGSISETAVQLCRKNRIQVIVGGCPMMFCPPVDVFHRCLGWFSRRTGKIYSA